MTAPAGSETTPVIVPVPAWPKAAIENSTAQQIIERIRTRPPISLSSFSERSEDQEKYKLCGYWSQCNDGNGFVSLIAAIEFAAPIPMGVPHFAVKLFAGLAQLALDVPAG